MKHNVQAHCIPRPPHARWQATARLARSRTSEDVSLALSPKGSCSRRTNAKISPAVSHPPKRVPAHHRHNRLPASGVRVERGGRLQGLSLLMSPLRQRTVADTRTSLSFHGLRLGMNADTTHAAAAEAAATPHAPHWASPQADLSDPWAEAHRSLPDKSGGRATRYTPTSSQASHSACIESSG